MKSAAVSVWPDFKIFILMVFGYKREETAAMYPYKKGLKNQLTSLTVLSTAKKLNFQDNSALTQCVWKGEAQEHQHTTP